LTHRKHFVTIPVSMGSGFVAQSLRLKHLRFYDSTHMIPSVQSRFNYYLAKGSMTDFNSHYNENMEKEKRVCLVAMTPLLSSSGQPEGGRLA